MGGNQPLSWELGQVDFKSQFQPSGLGTSDTLNGGLEWNSEIFDPLPEIQHVFRPDVVMPNAAFSIVFALLTVVIPSAVFFLYGFPILKKLSFNPSKVPFLSAIVLFSLQLIFVATLAIYWFEVLPFLKNVLQLLQYTVPLLIAVHLAGQWHVKGVSERA